MNLDNSKRFGLIFMVLAFVMGWLEVGPVMAELLRTGQLSCYDQAGNVIEHAGTGQDGDLQSGAVWPVIRFTNNGDGTITDRLTGLMWLMDGGCLGTMSWQAAMETGNKINSIVKNVGCNSLTAAYDDWSLPEIRQLETLFNGQEPAISDWLNYQGFRNVRSSGYWSSTTGPNLYSAWAFRLDSGEVEQKKKVEYLPVLLVRHDKPKAAAAASGDSGHFPTTERFVDNGDGTVTDTVNGLMWLQNGNCFEESRWQDALDAVKRLNDKPDSFNCLGLTADYADWALPNRHELRSLIDHQVDLPALPKGHPFVGIGPLYWTSTTVVSRPDSAYDLHMGSGDLRVNNKQKLRSIWPVRAAAGRVERKRVQQQPPDARIFSLLRPIGGYRNISWPPQRFTDHGDGTVLDNITGLMWLKDADCFTPESWERTSVVVNWLNTVPEKLKRQCAEYSGRYDDWRLPDLDTLLNLASAAEKEPAAWLNSQGVNELKARDYWTVTENPVNLYYAWAVNLRQGTPRNYSKSFALHFWPFRYPSITGPGDPKPAIKGNGKTDSLALESGTEFVLSVAIDNVTGIVPADFRIWYEAPDGTVRWLTNKGQWQEEEKKLYSGYIFKMTDYTVFHADTVGLKSGDYTFHFSIESAAALRGFGSPMLFPAVFELTLSDPGITEKQQETVIPEITEEILSQ